MAACGQRGDNLGEAVDGGIEAARVQGEGGVVFGDVDGAGGQDLALVDAVGHQVPGDGVARLARQQRPDRGIQACIAGQRAVVEVHSALRGAGQHGIGNERQIGDGQHPIHRQPSRRGRASPHRGQAPAAHGPPPIRRPAPRA
jgi:hypothetical protein